MCATLNNACQIRCEPHLCERAGLSKGAGLCLSTEGRLTGSSKGLHSTHCRVSGYTWHQTHAMRDAAAVVSHRCCRLLAKSRRCRSKARRGLLQAHAALVPLP